MRLSARLVGRKAFTQPPFWATDSLMPWSSPLPSKETIGNDFEAYVRKAYMDDGVVFACQMARQFLFSEGRFAWRRYREGRPGLLFTNAELGILERPWPNGTTGELLSRMDQDASFAGNFYATMVDDDGNVGRRASGPSRRLSRMRPDWVTIIIGSHSDNPNAVDATVVGYLYKPPPTRDGVRTDPTLLLPGEVVHYSPLPDPLARFRGMSWLTPILREVQADKAATKHKLKFFEQGATISTVVTLDKDITPEEYDEFVTRFKAQSEGVDMAYKTLFLGGGADVTLNGSNMQQLDFKVTQGAGETRIAAASGMHPTLVGLSEGLQGSSLNAGNFKAAVRLTGDKTIRPLWRTAAASLSTVLASPGSDSFLTYDDRDVAFLRDDTTDVAAIQSKQAETAASLVREGWDAASVVEYLETGNLRALKHTGLVSVQLQPPGTQPTPPVGG